jgi:uncharacterized damage-inducible protein DinB
VVYKIQPKRVEPQNLAALQKGMILLLLFVHQTHHGVAAIIASETADVNAICNAFW